MCSSLHLAVVKLTSTFEVEFHYLVCRWASAWAPWVLSHITICGENLSIVYLFAVSNKTPRGEMDTLIRELDQNDHGFPQKGMIKAHFLL